MDRRAESHMKGSGKLLAFIMGLSYTQGQFIERTYPLTVGSA